MEETTTIKRTWVQGFLNPQTIVYLGAGIVALVIFWIRTKESWDKAKQNEEKLATKADYSDIQAIKEQITRQYTTNKAAIDELDKQIDAIKEWVAYRKGYDQATKDMK